MKVLLCSPIREPAPVLSRFLAGLCALDPCGGAVDWLFADDNDDADSSALLRAAQNPHGAVRVEPVDPTYRPVKNDDARTHIWSAWAANRVGQVKDWMLRVAASEGYDYALLVDADLVLQPGTLGALLRAGKDICSEVFWTRWQPEDPELPNVWLWDQYCLHDFEPGEEVTQQEGDRRSGEWCRALRVPGVYRVGGLGACTLISRKALEAGCRFERLPNLSWAGEDRHFCIRAAALGLGLWADTHCPPLHLYRAEDLGRMVEVPPAVAEPASAPPPLVSRYMRQSDPAVAEVAGLRLPREWWSRPAEYAWALRFVPAGGPVLDAGCGIEHPLRWALAQHGDVVDAGDKDPRVVDPAAVRAAVLAGFGKALSIDYDSVGHFRCDIRAVPEEDCTYSRIFCISVLEHMAPEERAAALREFRRVVRPDGLVLLTVDAPPCDPAELLRQAEGAGLVPAGPVELGRPDDALRNEAIGRGVFRLALRPREASGPVALRTAPHVTLSMTVRNERGRYLERVLASVRPIIDAACIIDDASEDGTADICREALARVPLVVHRNQRSRFMNEWELRRQQWEAAVATGAEWILAPDADEEPTIPDLEALRRLLADPSAYIVAARLFDMWSPTHYRDDALWTAHRRWWPFLVRHVPGTVYAWNEQPVHCGRWPNQIADWKWSPSDIRVRHWSWARPEEREAKLRRYGEHDPGARYGVAAQYESVRDERPNLVEWEGCAQ